MGGEKESVCEDISPYCTRYVHEYNCKYNNYVRFRCKESCGLCDSTNSTEIPEAEPESAKPEMGDSGDDELDVASLPEISTTAESETDIPTTCHGKEGSYIGCYFDDAQRDIKNGPMKYGYNQQTCNSACQDYTYFCLQNDGWCACGNDYSTKPKYVRKPDNECGGARGLGRAWKNSVYKTCHVI